MDRSRSDRILEEWNAVTSQARRPDSPPRRVTVRGGLAGTGLAGASLLVVGLVIAVVWLGRPGPGPTGVVGGSPSTPPTPSVTPLATPSPSPTAMPSPTPSATPFATPTAKPSPTPTPIPTIGPCDPATLAGRVTQWEGAAGHRIADLELTNAGSSRCTVKAMAKPQLVDGRGSVLIDGSSPPDSALLTVAPGKVLKTLVDTSNYCGPAPRAPVSVAFVLNGGGRIVATPVSPTDATVPPCLGSPGSAGGIQMQPWAP